MDAARAVEEVRALRLDIEADARTSRELPEPSYLLDLASRQGDPRRSAQHIFQMCALHREGFRAAQCIKLAYLVSGYLVTVDNQNPVGVYLFARTILELDAFLNWVLCQLNDVIIRSGLSWEERGKQFFAELVRARILTSSPKMKRLLVGEHGLEEKRLTPEQVRVYINKLKERDGAEVGEYYAELCDFVHHNLSSQTVAVSGGRRASAGRVGTGGPMFRLPKEGLVLRYEYPAPVQMIPAIETTAQRTVWSIRKAVGSINPNPKITGA